MANDRAAQERKEDQQRADAQAAAQRDHDRAMQQQAQQHAVNLQNMQNEEAQRGRDFEKKQSAKERASQFSSQNARKGMDMTADHTGGAATQYADRFGGGGNEYRGKGFQQYDFTGKK